MATENEITEVEGADGSGSPPNDPKATQKTVRTKVPEVEIHLYREGKGPIDVFKSRLGGWDQDQLEVREILEKYGLKSIFAFNPSSGRGVPIPFGRNGRSLLGYRDGSVIHVDGGGKVAVGVGRLGLHDQTSDQDLTWDSSDHSFVNISSEGNSGMDQEIKPFRGKLPSMDPCLCCYRFYSHEEEN
uniref:Uncharacterized protein n=1 Tax=Salix viminalis TaxID=40686 RepID=A0A6N2NKI0_SALVM